MIRVIITYLRQPDDYPDDWYRWMGGQAGHAAIIGGPLVLLALLFGWHPVQAVTATTVAYGLLWETLIQRGPDWRDNLTDTMHVMAGAALISAPFAFVAPYDRIPALIVMGLIYVIWLAFLLIGIKKRIRKSDD